MATINGTVKTSCVCHNDYQDKQYGKGIRVMNVTQKQTENTIDVRCTVCGKVKTVSKKEVK